MCPYQEQNLRDELRAQCRDIPCELGYLPDWTEEDESKCKEF